MKITCHHCGAVNSVIEGYHTFCCSKCRKPMQMPRTVHINSSGHEVDLLELAMKTLALETDVYARFGADEIRTIIWRAITLIAIIHLFFKAY